MSQTPLHDGALDALLTYIHDRRNFDFRGYKRGSLVRRIAKRMHAVGVDDYQRYMDVLEANPGEFVELFNTILINVTSFLRDQEAWDAMTAHVIPALLRAKDPAEPVRVWSAGCASGEEAYSLAVVLAEALGEERFRHQVKIYATDADTEALVEARHGRYEEKDLLAAFGEQRMRRFFEMEQGFGVFRSDLRRSLIFGRHDLVQDPPISRIDLLVCRNTLMYFTSEVQQQVLTNFHFALNPGGYLFLGKSEALAARLNLFEPVEVRQHIFRKNGEQANAGVPSAVFSARTRPTVAVPASRLVDAVVEQSPVAQVVVDAHSHVLLANREARRLLSIGSSEVGLPLSSADLSLDVHELERLVEQVHRERRLLTVADVSQTRRGGQSVTYDLILSPLDEHSGVGLWFHDVTRYRDLGEELERSQQELESAYEELQSAVEELETTNEELQSTNEELETTNEELHSTNEELETMNEELQSTNEELETSNNELRVRSVEVDDLNSFLESILDSLQPAVVVLGPDMEVRAWNRQAEDLWGLRADEVQSQHFLNLDVGFPVETLGPTIRACLAGRSESAELTQAAVNRRGRPVDVNVTVSCLLADDEVRGVILLMSAVPREGVPLASVPD